MVKFYKNILKLKRYLFEIQWIVGVQCLYLYQVNRRFEKARAEKKPIYVCILGRTQTSNIAPNNRIM